MSSSGKKGSAVSAVSAVETDVSELFDGVCSSDLLSGAAAEPPQDAAKMQMATKRFQMRIVYQSTRTTGELREFQLDS